MTYPWTIFTIEHSSQSGFPEQPANTLPAQPLRI